MICTSSSFIRFIASYFQVRVVNNHVRNTRANQVNKKFIAAALGNWLEWYDFGVYAALADLLGQHFFPDHDASVQVMQSFLAFAAGYISRPVGGILIGIIGDRLGRKSALWLDINMTLIYVLVSD